MPHSPSEAKPDPYAAPWLGLPLRAPLRFALAAAAVYAILCLPILAMHRFDPSVFIDAGDRYVSAAQTYPTLLVQTHSDGYDGQFYYRMAVTPFSARPTENGIRFDHPAKRLQRVLYSLLATLAAAGRPAATPWSMLLVNLAGVGAIAIGAARVSRHLALPGSAAYAILLWPGLFVTLSHDTTEIISLACMIWAVASFVSGRWLAYAAFAGAATLARETNLAWLLGLLGWETWQAAQTGSGRETLYRLAPLALALLPFALWHAFVLLAYAGAPNPQAVTHDLGPPFLGIARMLSDCVTGSRHWASTPFKDEVIRGIVLATAPVILLVCARVAISLPGAFRRPDVAPLAAAWTFMACLMSLLTANGPWIDPLAYFRAFSECFVLGCIVLFAGACRPAPRLVVTLGVAGCALIWFLCLSKLRAG